MLFTHFNSIWMCQLKEHRSKNHISNKLKRLMERDTAECHHFYHTHVRSFFFSRSTVKIISFFCNTTFTVWHMKTFLTFKWIYDNLNATNIDANICEINSNSYRGTNDNWLVCYIKSIFVLECRTLLIEFYYCRYSIVIHLHRSIVTIMLGVVYREYTFRK